MSKRLEQAFWQNASEIVQTVKLRTKIVKALSENFWAARTAALAAQKLSERDTDDQHLELLQTFTKDWIHGTAKCSTMAMESAKQPWTEKSLTKLFVSLIAPPQSQESFCCLPEELTTKIGRPPVAWRFITETIEELLDRSAQAWQQREEDLCQPPMKSKCNNKSRKRKKALVATKTKGTTAVEEQLDRSTQDAGNGITVPRKQKKVCVGHPRCTSKHECVGHKELPLVRHILNGVPCDYYCEFCWNHFLETKNPDLEGIWESATGHPRCASHKECIGSHRNRLIRHYINEVPGDCYCEACWESFTNRNPRLDGFLED